ncbi:hypothetical protein RRG08_033392 [Elysia crispata]|uniref:Uncharacterized protein n=1 Tax=Elysia crispata TaxID=231223 RepID=A0AAE0YZK2_9GAST|nr:hypothetical protein RRG08_033392 [Elysia crispata]
MLRPGRGVYTYDRRSGQSLSTSLIRRRKVVGAVTRPKGMGFHCMRSRGHLKRCVVTARLRQWYLPVELRSSTKWYWSAVSRDRSLFVKLSLSIAIGPLGALPNRRKKGENPVDE